LASTMRKVWPPSVPLSGVNRTAWPARSWLEGEGIGRAQVGGPDGQAVAGRDIGVDRGQVVGKARQAGDHLDIGDGAGAQRDSGRVIAFQATSNRTYPATGEQVRIPIF
jgi:hypothetical protein